MNKTTTENEQQAANRKHAMNTNTQRIRFVRTTVIMNGKRRHILEPTTPRDRPMTLPDISPLLGHGYAPQQTVIDRHLINGLKKFTDQCDVAAAAYRGDAL